MSDARNSRPWTKHLGLPQIPIMITNPQAFVQIKEDGVRGRCRVAPACDVDWERVTHWRWDAQAAPEGGQPKSPTEMTFRECAEARRQLASERILAERELKLAKRSQDTDAISNLGHIIQTMSQRASVIKQRMHELDAQANGEALKQAAKDILPADVLRKLYDRASAIQEALLR